MAIAAWPDHVAVAVHDIRAAAARWHDQLGGGWHLPRYDQPAAPFATRQLTYHGGARLELLEPLGEGFASRFLERFGPRLHHLTLKVESLRPAIEELRDADFDVVDVLDEGDWWQEGFLRPSQVGGLIVQIAWSGKTDDEWQQALGYVPQPPADDGARLLGPTLAHPDLDAARDVWETLGGKVDEDGDGLLVRWDDAPLTVRIEPGPAAGPTGLRFGDAAALPADDVAGPAVLEAGRL